MRANGNCLNNCDVESNGIMLACTCIQLTTVRWSFNRFGQISNCYCNQFLNIKFILFFSSLFQK